MDAGIEYVGSSVTIDHDTGRLSILSQSEMSQADAWELVLDIERGLSLLSESSMRRDAERANR